MIQTQQYRTVFEDEWDELKSRISFAATYKEHWPSLIPLFEQISQHNAVFVMIWNMLTNKIIYTVDKKKVTGHPSSRYLAEDGVDFTMSNVHPQSRESALKQQQCAIRYFIETPKENVKKIVVNMEGVSMKITGKYFHLLQQTVPIESDSQGNPFLFLSYVHDITHIKKQGTANLVITVPEEVVWWNFNYERSCLDLMRPLTRQEKVILNCLAEGKSSKDIAGELFISPSTVDTHRKQLLKKTNCIDTTGMITYLRLVGLI